MKVTLSGTAVHERGLQLWLVIHGPQDSWIRFASLVLDVPNLDTDSRKSLVNGLSIGLPSTVPDADQPSLWVEDLD